MDSQYLLAERTIPEEDIDELIAWLKTDPWLTQGQLVRSFEEQWAKWLGCQFATYVNSGSSANLLMYYAFLLSGHLRNRKVIVPAVSWATSVAPAIQLGFEPLLCEADRDTFGVDLVHLEKLLTEHDPAAVLIVHVLGVPNQMEPLLALKRRYDFVLMEDACAGTGSLYDGRKVGTFGDISSFSFFYGHHMSTIEGGMVCTGSEEIHDILVEIRSHGWPKDLAPEKEEKLARSRAVLEFNRPFTFYHPGFNVRSTDLNAHIGLSQMKRLDQVVRRRMENHRVYQSRLSEAPRIRCQRNDRAEISSISFCALASSEQHRDRIAARLREKRIETRPLGGGNMSRQPFWTDRYGVIELPFADQIHNACFQLPNHPRLSVDDVHFICDTVLEGDR